MGTSDNYSFPHILRRQDSPRSSTLLPQESADATKSFLLDYGKNTTLSEVPLFNIEESGGIDNLRSDADFIMQVGSRGKARGVHGSDTLSLGN